MDVVTSWWYCHYCEGDRGVGGPTVENNLQANFAAGQHKFFSCLDAANLTIDKFLATRVLHHVTIDH